MIGSLCLGMVVATACTVLAITALGAGLWTGGLVYILSGVLGTLVVAWRRIACEDARAAMQRDGRQPS